MNIHSEPIMPRSGTRTIKENVKKGLEMAQFYPDSRPARSLAALNEGKLLRPDHSQTVTVTVFSQQTVRRFRVPNSFKDRPGG